MKTDPQTNQEMMGKGHQEHMVMPTQPTAGFVMIQTNFAFIFFKNNLNWPPHPDMRTNSIRGVSTGALLK